MRGKKERERGSERKKKLRKRKKPSRIGIYNVFEYLIY